RSGVFVCTACIPSMSLFLAGVLAFPELLPCRSLCLAGGLALQESLSGRAYPCRSYILTEAGESWPERLQEREKVESWFFE
ncbi:MAG: hypothetical protein LUI87_00060, partial [Lachnospiraceae bacterium]|nr:hypothetical protein [Lachnospiraceae bacterium]